MLNDIISKLGSAGTPYDIGGKVLAEVTSLVPILLPCIIGFIAFRKGWKFLRSALKSA